MSDGLKTQISVGKFFAADNTSSLLSRHCFVEETTSVSLSLPFNTFFKAFWFYGKVLALFLRAPKMSLID